VRNILDFQEDFPDARVVKLEQNYRSTETILQAANAVIANNRGGIAKRLWSELGQGDQVQVRELEDEARRGAVRRRRDRAPPRRGRLPRRDRGSVSHERDVASPGGHARAPRDRLSGDRRDKVLRGAPRSRTRSPISPLLANPFDVVSFTRVANSPRRGLGQTSLSRIVAHSASVRRVDLGGRLRTRSDPRARHRAIKALRRFMDTMEELRLRVEQEVPVADLLEAVLSQTGYVEALEAERTIEAQGRIENLEQLVQVGREFDTSVDHDARPPEDSLEVFLQQIALVADADSRTEDEGLVTLMTLHNAKGWSIDRVHRRLRDGVFPTRVRSTKARSRRSGACSMSA